MGHLKRYRQIAGALVRHGLHYLVGVFGLERFVPFHKGMLARGRPSPGHTPAEHVRMALEDLGATFVKLGQILSTRPDLVPPEYLKELARLQDDAAPIPGDEAEGIVAEELGAPVAELFLSFERAPLAAASIGQAHAAVLRSGEEVVVKVRRPGVVEQVTEDIEIVRNLALVASRRLGPAEHYDLIGLAEEFAETLRGELDYLREGRNAERFAEQATKLFFTESSPLPKASHQHDHYEAVTNGDTLMMALLQLRQIRRRPDVRVQLLCCDR